MVMAVFYLTQALGGYLGAAVVGFINAVTDPPWIGEDVNDSSLDLYFFVLCGLGVLNFFAYVWVSSKYQLQTHHDSKVLSRLIPSSPTPPR